MGDRIWAKIGAPPDTVLRFVEQYQSATGVEFRETSLRDMYGVDPADAAPAWWPPLGKRARVAVRRFGEGKWTSVAITDSAHDETLVYVVWVHLKN